MKVFNNGFKIKQMHLNHCMNPHIYEEQRKKRKGAFR